MCQAAAQYCETCKGIRKIVLLTLTNMRSRWLRKANAREYSVIFGRRNNFVMKFRLLEDARRYGLDLSSVQAGPSGTEEGSDSRAVSK